jgi:hypothetical protein
MTIKYALTRVEIVRTFFQGLGSSPRFLAMILIYSAALGVFTMATRGAFSRPLTSLDIIVALAWMAGAFVFMPLWPFVRGKTDVRTLTVSPEGISTEIGSTKGKVPWSKVKLITNTSRYVLIVGATGNAFFIPSRAFQGPDQQAQFTTQIELVAKSEVESFVEPALATDSTHPSRAIQGIPNSSYGPSSSSSMACVSGSMR